MKAKTGFSFKKTTLIAKNSGQKSIKKQPVNVKTLYKNINHYLENRDWKNLRLIGLDLFSKVVHILANNKCQKCGKVGTDAHHWCYTKSHGSMTDIMPENGILLCRKCHIEAHENFNGFKLKVSCLPKYENTEEKLKKFVNASLDYAMIEEIIRNGMEIVKQHEEQKRLAENGKTDN